MKSEMPDEEHLPALSPEYFFLRHFKIFI